MKVCPVCQAAAFDDAQICYGCLHDYREDETRSTTSQQEEPQQSSTEHHIVSASLKAIPEFLVHFTPSVEESGSITWSCAVELASPN